MQDPARARQGPRPGPRPWPVVSGPHALGDGRGCLGRGSCGAVLGARLPFVHGPVGLGNGAPREGRTPHLPRGGAFGVRLPLTPLWTLVPDLLALGLALPSSLHPWCRPSSLPPLNITYSVYSVPADAGSAPHGSRSSSVARLVRWRGSRACPCALDVTSTRAEAAALSKTASCCQQVLVLFGRAVNIFPLSYLLNFFRDHRITPKMAFIMWFSGKCGRGRHVGTPRGTTWAPHGEPEPFKPFAS